MSTSNQPQPCKRPGCTFDRAYLTCDDGSYRRQRNCSAACRIWLLRAKRADKQGDSAEAAELMRLSELLDARRHPRDHVPGIFTEDREIAS